MNETLKILTDGQDPAIRRHMINRVKSMVSNLEYLRENKSEKYLAIAKRGWTTRRLEVIFSLNAFYLLVLGPLASSARGRSHSMWKGTPIIYGESIIFDNDRASAIRRAQQSFSAIAEKIPGGLETISANQASDIIFKLWKSIYGGEEDRRGEEDRPMD